VSLRVGTMSLTFGRRLPKRMQLIFKKTSLAMFILVLQVLVVLVIFDVDLLIFFLKFNFLVKNISLLK
jgi:hypothetical protein